MVVIQQCVGVINEHFLFSIRSYWCCPRYWLAKVVIDGRQAHGLNTTQLSGRGDVESLATKVYISIFFQHIVPSELKGPVWHSNEQHTGPFSSEGTIWCQWKVTKISSLFCLILLLFEVKINYYVSIRVHINVQHYHLVLPRLEPAKNYNANGGSLLLFTGCTWAVSWPMGRDIDCNKPSDLFAIDIVKVIVKSFDANGVYNMMLYIA